MGTSTAILRTKGGQSAATPGSVLMSYYFSFTATAAAAALTDGTGGSLTLPSGFVPSYVQFNGAATGGTDPTFILGIAGDTDSLIAEGNADGGLLTVDAGEATSGVGMGVKLTANKVVWGGVGTSAPTGGTVSGYIVGHVHDTGGRL